MSRCEATVERLMDPDSRRESIQRLPKVIKWSWVASVGALVGAVVAFLGQQPALCGLMMGVAAMNLTVGATNSNVLVLALYVDRTAKDRDCEPENAADR